MGKVPASSNSYQSENVNELDDFKKWKEKQNESLNEKDPVDSIVEQSGIEARKKSAVNEMRLKGMRIS